MFIFHVLSYVLCHLVPVFGVLLMPKLHMVIWPLRGWHWSQSCVALPSTTIGIVSVIFCLPLIFPFSIVRALGTDWGSLKMALESAHKSWGMHMPVEVVGWLRSTSFGGCLQGYTWDY